MAEKLIIANWKMNGGLSGLAAYIQAIADIPVVICPPTGLLAPAAALMKGQKCLLGAQDCHAELAGAHTGDTSAALLKELGVSFVILGHSERRRGHGENDAFIWRKVALAAELGLVPILCVGEREGEDTKETIERQLKGLEGFRGQSLVVAYEPPWAISAQGTGRMPSIQDIKDAHIYIKVMLEKICPTIDSKIVYGGSVKPENSMTILAEKLVDGALVGAASLDPTALRSIYTSGQPI